MTSVVSGKRAIWEIGQVRVLDGGQDGMVSTTSGDTVFVREGILVP
jgi:hypothetical protein